MKRIALLVCLAGLCRAQPGSIVQGEVVADEPADFGHFSVRLEDTQHQQNAVFASVNLHGEFRLEGLQDGLYLLRVLDERGAELVSQAVSVSGASHERLWIRLPPAMDADRPRGAVSVGRLIHKPDRKAMQAAMKAERFAERGDREQALAGWSRTVELDPQFSDAWNNLGVAYLRTGRPQDAIHALQTATSEDNACARCYSNLAIALFQVHRLEDAETSARRSVQLDPESEIGRSVLRNALAARRAAE